jgi:hypothetical protein
MGVALAGSMLQAGPKAPNSPSGGGETLYSQPYDYDNRGNEYTQSYTETYPGGIYTNTQAADDFTIPQGQTWAIQYVFAGAGGLSDYDCSCAAGYSIYIYSNAMSGTQEVPGTEVYSYDSFTDNSNSFSPNTHRPEGGTYAFGLYPEAVLTSGKYWLSVQYHYDYTEPLGAAQPAQSSPRGSEYTGPGWAWRNSTELHGSPAVWRSTTSSTSPSTSAPSGSTACGDDWGIRSTDCGMAPTEPDQEFALSGDRYFDSYPTPIVEACGPAWRITPSEHLTATYTEQSYEYLMDVSMVSAYDGWAVGYAETEADYTYAPMIQRWDGTGWNLYPSPIVTSAGSYSVSAPAGSSQHSFLEGVDMLSATNGWAVGEYYSATAGDEQTLIMRFNGSSWSVFPSPNVSETEPVENYLLEVDAVSSTNAWAVGWYVTPTLSPDNYSYLPLIMHYNGTDWQISAAPYISYTTPYFTGFDQSLDGVSAVPGSNQVWAVGFVNDYTTGNTIPLTLRYNGTSWQNIPTPFNTSVFSSSDDFEYRLYSVSALSQNNVWAVGSYNKAGVADNNPQTLVMHWNGSSWSVVPSPNRTLENELYGVQALSANNIWAVGEYSENTWGEPYRVDGPTAPGESRAAKHPGHARERLSPEAPGGTYGSPLVMHWDGLDWQIMDTPQQQFTHYDILFDLDAVSPEDIHAVGIGESNNAYFNSDTALTERYNDPCVASCTTEFPDVEEGSTFYPFVKCLVCRQIISGFGDGTFRPGANVTRGQLAKIVSNAARFNEAVPSNQQTFADIPYSTDPSSYWVYVERLNGRGVIGGYACGGTNPDTGEDEDCDGENRPYYRPGSLVTRGQASKIVSQAAGFVEDVPATQQTYQDVPPTGPGSTFWVFIERLSSRGVMGGYPCGTPPAGSCQPGNRPYFLPGNNLSRGQAAKIVANTFYPGCETLTRK